MRRGEEVIMRGAIVCECLILYALRQQRLPPEHSSITRKLAPQQLSGCGYHIVCVDVERMST